MGLGSGYPGDVSDTVTGWGLSTVTGITVPGDGLCEEISTAAVWAGEARIDAHGTYFGVVRHEGEWSMSRLQDGCLLARMEWGTQRKKGKKKR